jgi:murein DD-endopeptidase MepM/ murein hydrolase activator NlpD
MKYFLQIFVIFALMFAASCKHRPAKIVNRSSVVYDRNNHFNKNKYSDNSRASYLSSKSNSSDKVKVRSGDTLYAIAKRHNVTLRDLIKENKLTPPYSLKTDERLTIPKPRYHHVQTGDTLYSISRNYNTKLNHLIELNDLKRPYSLSVGEKIRINKFSTKKISSGPRRSLVSKSKHKKPGFFAKTLDKLNKFSWPTKGPIVSKFGPKSGGLYNDGVNILAKSGADVRAAEDGVVAYVGNELKGYGNLVIIKHSGGWITAYAHLKSSSVKRGQRVAQKEKIGDVGASGNVDSPQLYFGLRKGRDAVNPLNYLSKS